MTKFRHFKLVFLIIVISLICSGCWNYREIDRFAIVSGFSIDKSENGNYKLGVEIVDTGQSSQSQKLNRVIVSYEGQTIFDAIRGMIDKIGRRLYWSHATVGIIGEGMAKDGIIPVLDWINRNEEVRLNMSIIIAKGCNAIDILYSKPLMEDIIGYQIYESLLYANSVSHYKKTELWELVESIEKKFSAAIVPVIQLEDINSIKIIDLGGSAILKDDKLIGYLNENDTKSLLIVRDEFEGGVIVIPDVNDTKTSVSLEVFKCKTVVSPKLINGKIVMKIDSKIDAAIGELTGSDDFIGEPGRDILKSEAQDYIAGQMAKVIKKIQDEFRVDVFNFAGDIKRKDSKLWRQIEDDWEEINPELEVDINIDLYLRGSTLIKKPVGMGED